MFFGDKVVKKGLPAQGLRDTPLVLGGTVADFSICQCIVCANIIMFFDLLVQLMVRTQGNLARGSFATLKMAVRFRSPRTGVPKGAATECSEPPSWDS